MTPVQEDTEAPASNYNYNCYLLQYIFAIILYLDINQNLLSGHSNIPSESQGSAVATNACSVTQSLKLVTLSPFSTWNG